nr:MAG TPA: hypothetical protein [Bacteriophage sp.]
MKPSFRILKERIKYKNLKISLLNNIINKINLKAIKL